MTNFYIVGQTPFSYELYDQLVLQEKLDVKYTFIGFIHYIKDTLYCTSAEGIKPFTYPENSAFALGVTGIDIRQKYIYFLNKYYKDKEKTYPNIVLGYESKLCVKGIGNIIMRDASLFGACVIKNYNVFQSGTTVAGGAMLGNNNIIEHKATILSEAELSDNNVLEANSVINKKVSIASQCRISIGECLSEDLGNNYLYQSGYSQKNK